MSRAIRIDALKWRTQTATLQHVLQGQIAEARAALREAVTQTAAETARALALRTFPSGFGFKLARDRMLHELSQLYATGGRVYQALEKAGEKALAAEFYHAYKAGNLGAAASALRRSRTSFASIPVGKLDPALHEKARNKTSGHIEVSTPWQIVPAEDLKFYQALAVKRLGKTASGWMACSEQLGGNGNNPKWKGTALHGSDGGSAALTESDVGYHVTLTNSRPLARKHLSPGQQANILRKARRDLNDRLIKGGITKTTRRRKAA